MVFRMDGLWRGMFMGWSDVDERLIRRGELLLSLDFLEGYGRELRRMNRGKVGRRLICLL